MFDPRLHYRSQKRSVFGQQMNILVAYPFINPLSGVGSL